MPVNIRYEDLKNKNLEEFRKKVKDSTKIEISNCINVLSKCDLNECIEVETLTLKKNNQDSESSLLTISRCLPSKIKCLKIIDSKLISLNHDSFKNCCNAITYLDLSAYSTF